MKLNKIFTRDLGELRIAMKRNHTRKELRLIFYGAPEDQFQTKKTFGIMWWSGTFTNRQSTAEKLRPLFGVEQMESP
jgi:hypothetical protein